MKIAVWHSGHEISDNVCNAVKEGLPQADLIWSHPDNYMTKIKDYDLHIAYGILRGCGEVFRQADKHNIPWFNIDRGYFKPGHYSGFYRISLNGTQQTFGLEKLEPDYERWDALELEVWNRLSRLEYEPDHYHLICPPTDYVCAYFGIDKQEWIETQTEFLEDKIVIREKATDHPIKWDEVRSLITFNSSVGWEALRQGIPVISDPTHSIVGTYQKLVDKPLHTDLDDRRRLFAIQASLQLTLPEVRSGKIWPLLQALLAVKNP